MLTPGSRRSSRRRVVAFSARDRPIDAAKASQTTPGMDAPAASTDSVDAGPAAWAPLRSSSFRALWLAAMVGLTGAWFQTVGEQWLLVSRPQASILVSIVQVATALPYVLFGLVAGVLADILDRRLILITVQLTVAGL